MLTNLIKSKNKPHAIIFQLVKICDLNRFINDYIKSIALIDLNSEEKKLFSKKIDDLSYYDIIKINGYESDIKKEQILNIQNIFSLSGMEKINKKFYVVYGIENITTQAANSLLKFLEEPPKNTYAIFVSKAPNKIISTIKSRCSFFILNSNQKKFEEILSKYKISNSDQIKIAAEYYSLNELENDLKEKKFTIKYEIINALMNLGNNLKKVKKTLDLFKKKTYPEIKEILDGLITLNPGFGEKLLEFKKTINFNSNKTLLFDNIWSLLN